MPLVALYESSVSQVEVRSTDGLLRLRLSAADALALAVDIVFLVDGTLAAETDNKGVQKWNTDGAFHRAYAQRFQWTPGQ